MALDTFLEPAADGGPRFMQSIEGSDGDVVEGLKERGGSQRSFDRVLVDHFLLGVGVTELLQNKIGEETLQLDGRKP